jgi:hypothetical protein
VQFHLRSRSYFIVNQAESDYSENMADSDVNCSELNAEGRVRVNPTTEHVGQNVNTVVTSKERVPICSNSIVDGSGMSSTQIQESLSTLLQTIQSENCKLTAASEAKLTSESNKQSAETAKQTAALEANINSKLTSATEKLKFKL